jgi:hypothetical protein
MPRVRMTIRRWMVLVAIVALLLGGGASCWRMKLRRDYCLQRARIHAWAERLARLLEKPPLVLTGSTHSPYRDELSILQRLYRHTLVLAGGHISPAATLAQYHHELKTMYQEAAARPWRSIPLDAEVP